MASVGPRVVWGEVEDAAVVVILLKRNKYVGILSIAVTTLQYIECTSGL